MSSINDNATCSTVVDDYKIASDASVVSETKPHLRIVPLAPHDLEQSKYDRPRTIYYPFDSNESTVQHISPLKTRFEAPPVSSEWIRHVAPEGKTYFQATNRPLLTMDNLEDGSVAMDIEDGASGLLACLREVDAPSDTEVVLSKTFQGEEHVIGYYLASISTQSVFWLEQVPSSLVSINIRPVISEVHLGLAVAAQLWTHVELFPNHRGLPEAAIREIKDSYIHGQCDMETSITSTFPYTVDRLVPLWRCIGSLKAEDANGYRNTIAARLLSTLYQARFQNFYGEPGVRLSTSESALKEKSSGLGVYVFAPMSLLLLGLPRLYMSELKAIYKDSTVHYAGWRRFMAQCQKDRQDLLVPTPIMLCANVGLLVFTPNEYVAARTLNYVSSILLCSVYATCQVLDLYERGFSSATAQSAASPSLVSHLSKWQSATGGFECFAVGLSLPRGLFSWGLLTFVTSLVTNLFLSSGLAMKLPVSTVLGTMFLVVVSLLWIELDCQLPRVRYIAAPWRSLIDAVHARRRKSGHNVRSGV
ncbi:uncharacterized protein PHACADRAFT_193240 [Phanerochaete carnosa HHB-10118-sp]|uniref:WW domain-containing protein n=1 Tax=Phanerochaete carnosa (strain HHB-10118-sp) TaxID=650164 RepID=K5V5Z0_PHACS|nr:uncharacterized protein PHACADRAFT_193240 [Phanerochaete carnosa HHB-10118-sp]EKM58116.1 hypothetical protein PHACADRAFT_193240 [Phanerochaete carnosa HHB-10118-sp]